MDAVSTGAVAETPDEIRAMDLNLMVLCGRLVSEPETRRFDTDATQLRMLVAVGSPIPSPRFDVFPGRLLETARAACSTARSEPTPACGSRGPSVASSPTPEPPAASRSRPHR